MLRYNGGVCGCIHKICGDLILVTATANKPELSVDIANTWAQNAVQAINLAYSGEQPLIELETQLAEAEKEYKTAQSALEAFIRENRISGETSLPGGTGGALAVLLARAHTFGGLVGMIGVILFQWWQFAVQPSHGETTSITANSITK